MKNKYNRKYGGALKGVPHTEYKDLLIQDKNGKLKKINPLDVKHEGSSFGLILDMYHSEVEKSTQLQENIHNAELALIDTLKVLGYNTPNVDLKSLIGDIKRLLVLIPNHKYVNYTLDEEGYIIGVESIDTVVENISAIPSDIENGYYYLNENKEVVKDEEKYNEYWSVAIL